MLELLEGMKDFNPEDSSKDAIFHRFQTQKESKLRWIPFKVQAITCKNYLLKIYSQTLTSWMLFKTSHCNSVL